MKILFFPEANFRPDHVQEYDYKGEVFEFFAEHQLDKEQYVDLDINSLTPVEALMKLNDIKSMLTRKKKK